MRVNKGYTTEKNMNNILKDPEVTESKMARR